MNDYARKKPLYRKVNTRARGVHHHFGGDFRHTRNQKRNRTRQVSMHGKKQRGLDYTPLYRFLLSKVGFAWDEVHEEAVARLDNEAPIFRLVALHALARRDIVLLGESTYYSGLFVDDEGVLQRVDPNAGPHSVMVRCSCCTHTFNGVRIHKK